jgi:hypothetical protein
MSESGFIGNDLIHANIQGASVALSRMNFMASVPFTTVKVWRLQPVGTPVWSGVSTPATVVIDSVLI